MGIFKRLLTRRIADLEADNRALNAEVLVFRDGYNRLHRDLQARTSQVSELREKLEKFKQERDAAVDDNKAFAEDVAHQFGYHSQYNGRLALTHGGLSTLEWAFDILEWENPHPDPENECQWEGCHHYASCGTPANGGYLRLCGYHFSVLRNGCTTALSIKSATDTNVGHKEEE